MSACKISMVCTLFFFSSVYDMDIEIFFLQILTGHQDNAEFALAMCPTEPYVLSGGGLFIFNYFCYFN